MGSCLLCAKCCHETEMLLANEDVERIEINMPRREFLYLRDGYLYLKNKHGCCIFLNKKLKRCSIYEIRPQGCRFYPIIYDPLLKKCVVDKECTNKGNIPINLIETSCPDLEEFILLLEEERSNRLNIKN